MTPSLTCVTDGIAPAFKNVYKEFLGTRKDAQNMWGKKDIECSTINIMH